MAEHIGSARDCSAEAVRDQALRLYGYAAADRGAGRHPAGRHEVRVRPRPGPVELILIDEALTPDSSRFWDAATYEPGRPQASFDKQFVRDWLEAQPWDKTAPGPALPDDVVAGTRARYVEAFERITGASFERYLAGGRHRPMTQLPVRGQRHAEARHPRSRRAGRSRAASATSGSRASAPSASAGASS